MNARADLEMLLPLYHHNPQSSELRRPPWTWAALTPEQAAALARLIEAWIFDYNQVDAETVKETVPECWPQHPGLAHALAIQTWLYYAVHLDTKANPLLAADFKARHLANFRATIDKKLGVSPIECHRGQHVDTWRGDLNDILARAARNAPDEYFTQGDPVQALTSMHFGFPYDDLHAVMTASKPHNDSDPQGRSQ